MILRLQDITTEITTGETCISLVTPAEHFTSTKVQSMTQSFTFETASKGPKQKTPLVICDEWSNLFIWGERGIDPYLSYSGIHLEDLMSL